MNFVIVTMSFRPKLYFLFSWNHRISFQRNKHCSRSENWILAHSMPKFSFKFLYQRTIFYSATVAGPPENVTVVCKYDNISHVSSVYASWSPPKQSNGEIVNYYVSIWEKQVDFTCKKMKYFHFSCHLQTTITGNATYVNEDGNLSNSTYGPKSRSLKNDSRNVHFEMLPPNTNYTWVIFL